MITEGKYKSAQSHFPDKKGSAADENKFIDDLVDDLILDATDFIGNDPCLYNASREDLQKLCTNKMFRDKLRADLSDMDDDELHEFSAQSQQSIADFLWKNFQCWSYGV